MSKYLNGSRYIYIKSSVFNFLYYDFFAEEIIGRIHGKIHVYIPTEPLLGGNVGYTSWCQNSPHWGVSTIDNIEIVDINKSDINQKDFCKICLNKPRILSKERYKKRYLI